jgi:hypothetical protein
MNALPTASAPPVADLAKLRFSSGYEQGRRDAKAGFKRFVGWTTEVGKHPEIDAVFEGAGVSTIEIKHPSSVEIAWLLGQSIDIFPLCGTPPRGSMLGLNAAAVQLMGAAGLGAYWAKTEDGRPTSRIMLHCYPWILVENGLYQRCQLSAKGLQCDKLLSALGDHARAVMAARKILGEDNLSLLHLRLPLGCGEEFQAGRGEKSSPMTPLISRHPRQLTAEYVHENLAPPALIEVGSEEWPSTQDWSTSISLSAREPAPEPLNTVPTYTDLDSDLEGLQ